MRSRRRDAYVRSRAGRSNAGAHRSRRVVEWRRVPPRTGVQARAAAASLFLVDDLHDLTREPRRVRRSEFPREIVGDKHFRGDVVLPRQSSGA
jgi:hypothetical protein